MLCILQSVDGNGEKREGGGEREYEKMLLKKRREKRNTRDNRALGRVRHSKKRKKM